MEIELEVPLNFSTDLVFEASFFPGSADEFLPFDLPSLLMVIIGFIFKQLELYKEGL